MDSQSPKVEKRVEREDWDNDDCASPVLQFDLALCDIRHFLIEAIQAKTETERLQWICSAHEYVRGCTTGNRFGRPKPAIMKISKPQEGIPNART